MPPIVMPLLAVQRRLGSTVALGVLRTQARVWGCNFGCGDKRPPTVDSHSGGLLIAFAGRGGSTHSRFAAERITVLRTLPRFEARIRILPGASDILKEVEAEDRVPYGDAGVLVLGGTGQPAKAVMGGAVRATGIFARGAFGRSRSDNPSGCRSRPWHQRIPRGRSDDCG